MLQAGGMTLGNPQITHNLLYSKCVFKKLQGSQWKKKKEENVEILKALSGTGWASVHFIGQEMFLKDL